jgi:uncharacterized protein with PIN domain
MEEKEKLICTRCHVELQEMKTNFMYLDHGFHAETLRCPSCGQVYLSEELVKGRMAEVEYMLEDK